MIFLHARAFSIFSLYQSKSSFLMFCILCLSAREITAILQYLQQASTGQIMPFLLERFNLHVFFLFFSPFRQIQRNIMHTLYIWSKHDKLLLLWIVFSLCRGFLSCTITHQLEIGLKNGCHHTVSHKAPFFLWHVMKRSSPHGKRSGHYCASLMVMLSVGSLSNGSFQQALKSSVGSFRPQAVQPYAH